MPPPTLNQIILERFGDLPDQLQDSLEPDVINAGIEQIVEKYALSAGEGVQLKNEIALVLLAFEPYEDLPKNIAAILTLPEEKAKSIARELFTTFVPPGVRATLDSIYRVRSEYEIARSGTAMRNTVTNETQTPVQSQVSTPNPVADQQPLVSQPINTNLAPQSPVTPTVEQPYVPLPPLPVQQPPPDPPSVIAQYQKPLITPPYRNANLYRKPEGNGQPPTNLPTTSQ